MTDPAIRLPLGPLPADLHLPAGTVLDVDGAELVIRLAPARWSPTQRLLIAQDTAHARRCDAELPPVDAPRPARQPL